MWLCPDKANRPVDNPGDGTQSTNHFIPASCQMYRTPDIVPHGVMSGNGHLT